MRVGMGYDVHKLVEGRDLIMGGVKIDYEKGLLGHSDADVALHALSDAILGAAALGDIGKHFPDTDPRFEGADSRVLLREVISIVKEKGFTLVPSRYIEFVNRDENIDFDTKMKALQTELAELLVAEEKSKADLLSVFKELGYEIKL